MTPEGGVITKDEAMRHMHVVGPGKQVIDRRRPRQQMFPSPEHAAAGRAAYLTRGLPPDSLFSDVWPQVAKGADAVLTAYQAVGLGWIVWVFRLKIFSWIIHATYAIVSKHR